MQPQFLPVIPAHLVWMLWSFLVVAVWEDFFLPTYQEEEISPFKSVPTSHLTLAFSNTRCFCIRRSKITLCCFFPLCAFPLGVWASAPWLSAWMACFCLHPATQRQCISSNLRLWKKSKSQRCLGLFKEMEKKNRMSSSKSEQTSFERFKIKDTTNQSWISSCSSSTYCSCN